MCKEIFLKYTAQKITFYLLENDKEWLQQFKVDAKDRRYQIWERNPMSTDLYNHKTFLQKLEHIHRNPVQERWSLAGIVEEYNYSSARFYETGKDEWEFLTHYAG